MRSIRQGTFRAGEKLPPERELCRTLGVSRVLTGNALRELAEEGWLERRVGDGTYVADASHARVASPLQSVGIVFPDRHPAAQLVLDGLNEVLHATTCDLRFQSSQGNVQEEMRFVRVLLDRGTQSLLVFTSFPFDSTEGAAFYREIHACAPLVMTDCFVEGGFSTVATDNGRGSEIAADYLWKTCGGPGTFWVIRKSSRVSALEERVRGFSQRMQSLAGNGPNIVEVPQDDLPEQKQVIADALRNEVPAGVFLTSELQLPVLFEALDSVGLSRQNVAVCCYDNFHSLATLYGVAYLEQPCRAVGREAARCLQQQWQQPGEAVKHVRLVPLLVRPLAPSAAGQATAAGKMPVAANPIHAMAQSAGTPST